MKTPKLDPNIIMVEKDIIKKALDVQMDTFFLYEVNTGKAIRWNKQFREITGYTDEEISNLKAPDSYYDESDLIKAGKFIQDVVSQGTGKIELSLLCKDGKRIPTEYNVSLINDKSGKPKYFISIGRDITERINNEIALKESEEKFLQFMDTLPAIAFIKDSESKPLYINDYMQNVLGNKNWINKPLEECVPAAIAAQMIWDDKDTLKKGFKNVIEHVPDVNGKIRTFNTYKFKINRTDKKPLLGGIAIDITSQRKTEEDAREQREMLENIVNHSNEIFYIHDTNHEISYLSPASKTIMGYTSKEMKVKWTSLLTDNPMNEEGFKKTMEAIKTGKKQSPYLLEVIHKSGDLKIVEIDESPILDDSGKVIGITGAVRDVNKRIKAEEEVKKQQEHLEELIRERTADLEVKNKELERLNSLFVGREFRIKELRDRVKELETKLEDLI